MRTGPSDARRITRLTSGWRRFCRRGGPCSRRWGRRRRRGFGFSSGRWGWATSRMNWGCWMICVRCCRAAPNCGSTRTGRGIGERPRGGWSVARSGRWSLSSSRWRRRRGGRRMSCAGWRRIGRRRSRWTNLWRVTGTWSAGSARGGAGCGSSRRVCWVMWPGRSPGWKRRRQRWCFPRRWRRRWARGRRCSGRLGGRAKRGRWGLACGRCFKMRGVTGRMQPRLSDRRMWRGLMGRPYGTRSVEDVGAGDGRGGGAGRFFVFGRGGGAAEGGRNV